jgi:uncharacterized protein
VKNRTIIAVLIAAAAVGALFAPVLSTGQEPDLREVVSVSASSTVLVEPELARIFFSVHGDGATASEAADRLAENVNSVVDALKGMGFTDDDLSIPSVRVFEERNRDREIIGYTGRATVSVETDELDRIGEVIDVGTDAGASGVNDIEFDLKDNSEAIKEALRRSMRFAMAKADALATEAGRTRGRALVIDEGGSSEPRPASFAADGALGQLIGRGGGGGPDPIPIIPPDIKVRARIFVTFALQ